jgi:hypothetical protein
LFDNHLQKNGFYEKDGTSISTGPIYKNSDGDQMLYYDRIFVDYVEHNGWIVGPEVGSIGVSYLVMVNVFEFMISLKSQTNKDKPKLAGGL